MNINDMAKLIPVLEKELNELQTDLQTLHKLLEITERNLQKVKMDALLLEYMVSEQEEKNE